MDLYKHQANTTHCENIDSKNTICTTVFGPSYKVNTTFVVANNVKHGDDSIRILLEQWFRRNHFTDKINRKQNSRRI